MSRNEQYFGELALLNDEPRAATVTATEFTVVLQIDRDTFTRLIGPLQDILRRNEDMYAKYVADAGLEHYK